MRPDRRQGVYLRLNLRAARTPLYVGSVAGGKGRSFAAREREHLKELDSGAHPNNGMRKAHTETGGKGWVMIPIACVRRGDIAQARKIEGVIIKALRKVVCNERG